LTQAAASSLSLSAATGAIEDVWFSRATPTLRFSDSLSSPRFVSVTVFRIVSLALTVPKSTVEGPTT